MSERIGTLSFEPAVQRQAPKTSFGTLMASGATRASGALRAVAAPLMPGGATLSAAVSHVARAAAGGVEGGSTPGASEVSQAGASGPATEGAQGQRDLLLENRQWTMEYLTLQNEMQRESREFTVLSNILKVRHESAKTAINNIR